MGTRCNVITATLLGIVVTVSPGPAPASWTPSQHAVAVRRAWAVMGTALEIEVYRPAEAGAVADLRAAYDAIRDVDRRMSLYRPDSEVVRLNKLAGSGAIRVSPPLFAVLRASQDYARLSSGAFDVTVAPLVHLWGFDREPGSAPDDQHQPPDAIPEAARIHVARTVTGMDRLRLDPIATTAELAAGTRIDLGAIAKGWAVDRALDVLAARGVEAAIIDLGGNVGVLGSPPGERAWRIAVQHPRSPQDRLGTLTVRGRAGVATSGDYERFFEADGQRYAHVLDPHTGGPAQGVAAVTVVAPSAMAADALSTAVMVMGPEAGVSLLAGCRGIEGLVARAPESESPASAMARATPARLSLTATPGIRVHAPFAATVNPQARVLFVPDETTTRVHTTSRVRHERVCRR